MAPSKFTPLKIGMTGQFAGEQYRIVGRAVLCAQGGGAADCWDEFYLVGSAHQEATLVREQTERGLEWRLFTLIEPQPPLSAPYAAARRIGETIEINGHKLRITYVGQSRVRSIEGQAPEGVELGDIAHYFNAESGAHMYVVSWTGHEVEVYQGITFPARAVAQAFGLPSLSPAPTYPLRESAPLRLSGDARWLIVLLLIVMIVAGIIIWRSNRKRTTPSLSVPRAQLEVGATGTLDGTTYQVAGRALVRIKEVGRQQLRHEYALTNVFGSTALLLRDQRSSKTGSGWLLLTPISPGRALSPLEAGPLRHGDWVELEGHLSEITRPFLTLVERVEGMDPFAGGRELYGFMATEGTRVHLVRWNEPNLTVHRVAAQPGEALIKTFK